MARIGCLIQVFGRIVTRRHFSTTLARGQADSHKIGMREVVGHGINGQAIYVDSKVFPYPAIRFQEISPVYKALKEKEKGDWRSLTQDEKKTLYRVSFCQTFSEMNAPSGEWKTITGSVLISISAGLILFLVVRYITDAPLPPTFQEERRLAMLKRYIAFRANPFSGLASKWDYENDTWKK